MKKLKENQLGPFCSYCEPRTTRAVYRKSSWAYSYSAGFNKYCCEEHKESLLEDERKCSKDSEDSYSEADYSTWLRL